MKITSIGDEIYRELGSPTGLSIPVINFWLRTNLGKLNLALGTNYYINSALDEIRQEDPHDSTTFINIGEEEKTIFKLLYFLHYLDTKIRSHILSYDVRSPIELTSDGHTIRLVSPTEVGKNFASMRKEVSTDLQRWITSYKISKSIPRQVTGDDTEEGPGLSLGTYLSTNVLIN